MVATITDLKGIAHVSKSLLLEVLESNEKGIEKPLSYSKLAKALTLEDWQRKLATC